MSNMISADIPVASIRSCEYVFSNGKKLPAKPHAPMTIALTDFADGKYTVTMNLQFADGKSRATPAKTFVICRNPAWRNELGVLKDRDLPPAPWKKLTRNRNDVSSWNNTFIFPGNEFIANIRESSSGIMLLSKPLTITVNGEKIRPGAASWVDGSSRTLATMPCQGKNWRGTLKCKIDYTGFAHFTLDITAAGDFEN